MVFVYLLTLWLSVCADRHFLVIFHRLCFVYSHKYVLCIKYTVHCTVKFLRTKYAKTVHMRMPLVAGLLLSLSLEACGGGYSTASLEV